MFLSSDASTTGKVPSKTGNVEVFAQFEISYSSKPMGWVVRKGLCCQNLSNMVMKSGNFQVVDPQIYALIADIDYAQALSFAFRWFLLDFKRGL